MRRMLAPCQHPYIGAAAAALHGGDALARAQARQTAGQHAPATLRIGQGKHPQNHWPLANGGGCGVCLPHRRVRHRQKSLQSVGRAIAKNAARPFVAFALRQGAAHHRLKTVAPRKRRVAGLDHTVRHARQHLLHGAALAAPPALDGRQLEHLPQHRLGQRRHKAQQRAGLQKARARRVGHQHIACAHRLQQARHSQSGIGAQLQRVQPGVVHALEQPVHPLQALQGFEVELLLAHQQVAALHQRQAQVARQVGVFKIGFVVRARREQGDVRVRTGGRALLQPIHQAAVGLGQALHRHGLKGLRKLARDDEPVFQQIAQA